MSGVINQVIGNNTHFYPGAKQLLVSQLKAGTSLNVDDGRAVFALQTLNHAYQRSKDLLGFTPPKVTVLWNPCAILSCGGVDACFVSANLGEFGDYSSIVPNQIRIFTSGFQNRGWLTYAVGHEYGHYMHLKLQKDYWPSTSGPSPHYTVSVSNPGFAWKEGFAEFFGNWVAQEILGVSDPQGQEFFPQMNPDCRGISNEGHIAAFLWDLFSAENGWDGDDLYYPPHWGAFRQVMQENATFIITSRTSTTSIKPPSVRRTS
ncbi:MAG TPA: hypothetical protein VK465_00265 [Fibrobacteria bacterium]|nr:hypothetical protein [Fibrobacteria bacterium]